MNLKYLILALTIGLVLIYKSGSAQTIGDSVEAPSATPAPRSQQPIEAESLADLVEELSNFFEEILPEREEPRFLEKNDELGKGKSEPSISKTEPLIRNKRADHFEEDVGGPDLRVGADAETEVQEEPGRFRRLINKIIDSDLISRDMLISILAYLLTTILLLLIGPVAGPNAVLIVQGIKQGVPILLSYLLGQQDLGEPASEGADVAFDTLPEMSIKLKPVQAAAKSLYKMIF